MNKSRLEAFSDGVFAIIITIMVLELKVPVGTSWDVIQPLLPVFFSYVLSFVYVGIYWNNHHHILKTVRTVNAGIMWANMHLLFWLSLVPFATGWMGVNNFERITVAVYGTLLLICGVAFTLLTGVIVKGYKNITPLIIALRKDKSKSIMSVLLYICGVVLALFVNTRIAAICFIAVAIMWLIPNKAIEQVLSNEKDD